LGKNTEGKFNFRLAIYVIALNVIGILIINSASGNNENLVTRQIIGICVGIVAAGIITFIPYFRLTRLYLIVYLGCIALLTMVLVVGLIRGGARRWVVLPVIGQLQPSEFVKVGLILFFAQLLGMYQSKMGQLSTLLYILLYAAIPLVLIFLEPDLSTSIIIAVTIICMVYVAGLSYKLICLFLTIVIPLMAAFVLLIKNGYIPFISQYQANRILAFFDTTGAYSDAQLQQKNSIMAIASGMLHGKGLNNQALSSVKHGNFLSEQQTDFIFAVIGEELGFIGCAVIIILYVLIVFECFRMASKMEDTRARVICAGYGSLIAFQSFTNMAVATGLFPNTGLPLPFVSYGQSSLLSFYLGLGLVLSVGITGDRPMLRRFR